MKSEQRLIDFANETLIGQYLTRKERDIIFSYLEDVKDKLLLDICGGTGRFANPLYMKGGDIVVLDIDSVALSVLHKKNSAISLVQGDGQKIPFKNSIFDGILMIQSVEYIPDIDSLIKECGRVLKERGILLINFSNKSSYKRFRLKRKNYSCSYYKSYGITYREFKDKLKGAGLVIEKAIGYNWAPVSRMSNCKLILFFSVLEEVLRFEYLPSISPWVFIIARKSISKKKIYKK